jgi:iron(II)-dependent oxidoreductase
MMSWFGIASIKPRPTLPSEAEWEKAARGGEHIPVAVQVTMAGQDFAPIACELGENPFPQRAYPWGDGFVVDNANSETNVGATSTPGCFERGRSPYGCDDMAGNLWEWTRSLWGKEFGDPEFAYPYNPDDAKREDPDAGDNVYRVVRGGSWNNHRDLARCAFRSRNQPGVRDDDIGFRVVLRSSPVA